jgi:RNA polymerase sigma factor (sigma-70 family)
MPDIMAKKKLTYEELNNIVLAYQSGDPKASAMIVSAFEGLRVKYLNLISRGHYNLQDRTIREFLSLYMKDESKRRYIHQWRSMPQVRSELYKAAEKIHEMFKGFLECEIKHELISALLTLAKRYKSPDGKPRFHTYVQRAYRFQVQRQLHELIADPIAYRFQNISSYIDDEYDGVQVDMMDFIDQAALSNHIPLISLSDQYEDEINENWVMGHTTSEIFQGLTILERRILMLYYERGMKDQQIANQLGICRSSVNRIRLTAKRKIQDARKKVHNV